MLLFSNSISHPFLSATQVFATPNRSPPNHVCITTAQLRQLPLNGTRSWKSMMALHVPHGCLNLFLLEGT